MPEQKHTDTKNLCPQYTNKLSQAIQLIWMKPESFPSSNYTSHVSTFICLNYCYQKENYDHKAGGHSLRET